MPAPWVDGDPNSKIMAADAQRWDAKADPMSAETITGEWSFDGAAAPTVASVLIPTLDFDTGAPIPGQGLILTSDVAGTAGNMSVVFSPTAPGASSPGANQALAVASYNDGDNGPSLYITLPTDSDNQTVSPTPTTAELAAAINAAAVPVTASLPTGSAGLDRPLGSPGGFGTMTGGTDTPRVRMEGGAIRSAVRVEPEELSQVPLTLRTANGSNLGTAALNIEYRDGAPLRTVNGYTYGVTHLDNDGGGGFAADAITWSQRGNMVINAPTGQPLTLQVAGFPVMTAAGDSAALGIAARVVGDSVLVLLPFGGATADTLIAIGADGDSKTLRVRPDGAVITMGTEPADDDLAPGQVAWWFDPTEGAPRIRFKGKDTAGTVFDLSP